MMRGIVTALAFTWATSPAFANKLTIPPPSTKKHQYLASKTLATRVKKERWHRELRARIQKPPPDVINIYNTWTHEYVAVVGHDHRLQTGKINNFLRCHFTNEPTRMDPRLFEALVRAARHFKKNRIEIISGFRAPKYNLMLRKKGREVARRSHHTFGSAVDFRIPGVSTRRLQKWAKDQKLGGVGVYLHSGFVHMDTGPIRSWGGR